MLMKTSASMFVATATCGSIPNWIITGTVIRDVLPVTTLIKLVAKKTAIRTSSFGVGTKGIIPTENA
jgi:hypothetical protein